MLDRFVYKDKKKLRCGFTTGSCAAAASKAATVMLLSKHSVDVISIMTPKGIKLDLRVIEVTIGNNEVTCAIQKDAGDDADATNGILVYSTVKKVYMGVHIEGGIGVGRVTKPGLDQEIGQAAINLVPREMIREAVTAVCEDAEYSGGLEIIISIPQGIEIAKKTFNPRLGIEGGISVLGTSGIVEPMSEIALVDTIRAEMSMLVAGGSEYLIATPGNYGETFISGSLTLALNKTVKCSNFIGDTIDIAFEYKLKGLLFIGHIGKLVKIGAGIMNTHSKWADGRMEIICSCALIAGADTILLKKILECVTTDEALELLSQAGIMEDTMKILMKRIDSHLQHRAWEELTIGAVIFSNKYGLLGKTEKVDSLIKQLE